MGYLSRAARGVRFPSPDECFLSIGVTDCDHTLNNPMFQDIVAVTHTMIIINQVWTRSGTVSSEST
jgi:hypothetical protein